MTTEDRRNDLLNHYRSLRADLEDAIAGLSEAQMLEPTIDGWSIKDHLAHLALWDDLRVQEIARVSAGFDPAWKMAGELDEVVNGIAYSARSGWSLRQAMLEFQTSRQNLLDAIAAASARGLDDSLYGNAPLRSSHDQQHAEYIRNWRQQRGI
ncbi:MAG TPA: DinB family protein [Dehalococcoidia bacterium]|nr:DinB family protein [Dehalococcoidia bacterium]